MRRPKINAHRVAQEHAEDVAAIERAAWVAVAKRRAKCPSR